MPEDRTPHKVSLTEPIGEDEDLRRRPRRRKHEPKEGNRVFRPSPNGATSSEGGRPADGYGDAAPRKLI